MVMSQYIHSPMFSFLLKIVSPWQFRGGEYVLVQQYPTNGRGHNDPSYDQRSELCYCNIHYLMVSILLFQTTFSRNYLKDTILLIPLPPRLLN